MYRRQQAVWTVTMDQDPEKFQALSFPIWTSKSPRIFFFRTSSQKFYTPNIRWSLLCETFEFYFQKGMLSMTVINAWDYSNYVIFSILQLWPTLIEIKTQGYMRRADDIHLSILSGLDHQCVSSTVELHLQSAYLFFGWKHKSHRNINLIINIFG